MDIGGWVGLVKIWNSVEKEAYHFFSSHTHMNEMEV